MHCYRKTKEEGQWLYTVGYFIPDPHGEVTGWKWVPLEDTSKEEEARALVNYLNGGDGMAFQHGRTI
jgi:hypothetical protein